MTTETQILPSKLPVPDIAPAISTTATAISTSYIHPQLSPQRERQLTLREKLRKCFNIITEAAMIFFLRTRL